MHERPPVSQNPGLRGLPRTLSNFASALFVILIPLVLATSTVRIFFHSSQTYDYAIHDYADTAATGIEHDKLHEAAASLHAYLDGRRAQPDIGVPSGGRSITVFNPVEIGHLRDVKQRLDWANAVNSAALAYEVVFLVAVLGFKLKTPRQVASYSVKGAALTLAIGAVGAAASLLVFAVAWDAFHEIIFSGGWQFDPRTDRLIQMFPEAFWQDIVLLLGGAIALEAGLLLAGTLAWLRLSKPV